jgi:hypothetical protein
MRIQIDFDKVSHSKEDDDLEEKGRGGDTIVGHLTAGEIVLPLPLASDPDMQKMLKAIFKDAGLNLDQYTVGHPKNSINPETGYPEFGLKKVFKGAVNIVRSAAAAVGIGRAPSAPNVAPSQVAASAPAPAAPMPDPTTNREDPGLDNSINNINRKGRRKLRIDPTASFGGAEGSGLNIPT